LRFTTFLFSVAALMPLSRMSAQATIHDGAVQSDSDIVGLWGDESISGPQIRGEIGLRNSGGAWLASVGGFETTAHALHDTLSFTLPGGQGEFRSPVPSLRDITVRGFWIQPQGQLGGRYVSLVTLTRITSDLWRGTVEPLDETWSLYLLIQKQQDGSLMGYFRNPDMNWRGGAPAFRVVRAGDTLRFLDVASGSQRNAVTYDSAQRRIIMDFGRQIILTPRTRDQAVGFFPRTPATSSYTYRAPEPRRGDGWPTARAHDVGLDESRLAAFVHEIEQTNPVAPNAPAIHSLLVARHGKLVLEEYFAGYDATRVHDLRSASKTFTSVMLGVAMHQGKSIGPDTRVYSSFPNTDHLVAADPRRAQITLGNLLTHSSGLACDDNDDTSPGNEDRMQSQSEQPDWYRYTLELPVLHQPGTLYAYCSAGLNLAAGVIAHATQSWLPAFFDRNIAQPLEIDHYAINLTPTGQMYGGGGVRLRPRDLLKFGQLYLNGGTWNGHRIVDRSWVETSTAHQIDNASGSDGFAWHRFTLEANGRDYQEYEASGNGGQFLIVVPELDITIVITAGNYGQYGIWRTFREQLVPRYILGAIGSG
jgi:CubicO group peptidase (beta-lactamase class C family)